MVIQVCDICGKNSRPDFREKIDTLSDKRGMFYLEYRPAVLNEEGKVVGFDFVDNYICPECLKAANKAIWNVFDMILAVRETEATVELRPFPMEPVPEEVRYPEAPHVR